MHQEASIEERAGFTAIRYANCWEDADVLCRALAPLDGARVLSIASAGDNCFAMMSCGAEVVAADLSPAQLALVELKREAIRQLDDDQLLAFLGVRTSDDRLKVYEKLKSGLPVSAATYWDTTGGQAAIETGVIHAGKFEIYFQLFRRRVLCWIHGRKRVDELLREKSIDDRTVFYERRWNNWRWRLLFRVFFSRYMMGRLGRDPEFFRYVDEPVAVTILKRTRHALVDLPTHENPYLHYIVTGNYQQALPLYLQPDSLKVLRGNLDRLTLHHGLIQDVAKEHKSTGFDAYNLSDLFEYLSEDLSEQLYGELLEIARPDARLAYWNMMAPRSCPTVYLDRVSPDRELALSLYGRDLAWFYGDFHIDRVNASDGEAEYVGD